MKNQKIKRLLTAFILIDLLILGVYGYLFFTVNSKNKEIAALYAVSHKEASDNERIKELLRTLKETEKERNMLSAYFITKTNAVAFIERIEMIGKNADVNVTINSVADGEKDKSALQLNFSATGNFPNMYHFIALIESTPYKIALKKADIQKMTDRARWKGDFLVSLESFAASSPAATSTEAKS